MDLNLLAANGFTIVYRQVGRVVSTGRLRGDAVPADQFIAVRSGLMPIFATDRPVTVEFK